MSRNKEFSYKKYLYIFYIRKFFGTFYIYNPILIYYLTEKIKLNIFQVSVITASFYISSIIFDIPSGVIADKIGRKKSLQIGYLIQTISILLIAMSKSFSDCLIAHILLSLGVAFISGAEETLLYELYNDNNELKSMRTGRGLLLSSTLIASVLASLLSSILVVRSYELTFYVTAIFISFAIYLSGKVYESTSIKKSYRSKVILKDVLQEFKSNRPLLSSGIYRVLYGGIFASIYMNFQIYMNYIGVDKRYSGIFYSLLALCPIIAIKVCSQINGNLVRKCNPVIIMSIFFLLGYTKNIYIGIMLLCLVRLMFGGINPFINSRVDLSIKNYQSRSTILSTIGTFESLITAIMMVLDGKIIDVFGIKYMMYLYCVIVGFDILIKMIYPYMKKLVN